MHVQFSDHNILAPHISTYGSYMPVECKAILTDDYNKSESYTIVYSRNPITGQIRSVVCCPKDDTTENTLSCKSVEDYCYDALNN